MVINMRYILSIDGGGTSTEFLLTNMKGDEVYTCETGSSNYKSVGIDNMKNSFVLGLEKINKMKDVSIKDIDHAVFGISGNDNEKDLKIIEGIVEQLGFVKNQYTVLNDAVIAYYAKTTSPGLVIISGTGSIVMSINTNGEIQRSGGWGYNISDSGSGYWIGSAAIRLALLNFDGAHKDSLIFKLMREKNNLEGLDFVDYLVNINNNYEISKYAEIVCFAAEQGDTTALDILQSGAELFLKLSLNSVKNNSLEDLKLNLVLSGGVFKSEIYKDIVLKELDKKFSDKLSLVESNSEAKWGGINYVKNKTR